VSATAHVLVMDRLFASPLASDRIVLSGHVLRLETGLVETVLEAPAPTRRDAA